VPSAQPPPTTAQPNLVPGTTANPNAAAAPNAQSSSGRPQPGGANSSEQSRKTQRGKNALNDGLADCMQLWDAGTHMTKQQWARTCKRVQSRIENLRAESLKVDSLDTLGRGRGKEARTSRE
jgi:hypothetical protein